MKRVNFEDVFTQFDQKWALVTAGTEDAYNTMTISWGGVGTLWSVPACTVYVNRNRYTWQFMEANEYFTVSFYPQEKEYRRALAILGSKSGRDGDKVALTTLTPVYGEGYTTFAQAELTLVCRKMLRQDLDISLMPEAMRDEFYDETEGPHTMYVGQVVDVLTNEPER